MREPFRKNEGKPAKLLLAVVVCMLVAGCATGSGLQRPLRLHAYPFREDDSMGEAWRGDSKPHLALMTECRAEWMQKQEQR